MVWGTGISDAILFKILRGLELGVLYWYMIIKRPTRDACLYVGEATPLDPHFLFAIASQP